MKKKYRDIVVDDKPYAWTFGNHGWELCIWENKKIIHSYTLKHGRSQITPSLVALIIRNPEFGDEIVNGRPCPFCGKVLTGLDDAELNKSNIACVHDDDCWLRNDLPVTVIGVKELGKWNGRD